MKVALYARVSKASDQTVENQLLELRKWAANSGHEVSGEFVDEISSRDTRPEKERLKRLALLGEVKGIAFASLDRWGRDMSELVLDIEDFGRRGIVVYSMREALAFDSAAGRLYAHLMAAFASFERDRIRERTMQGLARARAQGKKLGRPKGVKETKPRNFGGRITGGVSEVKQGSS